MNEVNLCLKAGKGFVVVKRHKFLLYFETATPLVQEVYYRQHPLFVDYIKELTVYELAQLVGNREVYFFGEYAEHSTHGGVLHIKFHWKWGVAG